MKFLVIRKKSKCILFEKIYMYYLANIQGDWNQKKIHPYSIGWRRETIDLNVNELCNLYTCYCKIALNNELWEALLFIILFYSIQRYNCICHTIFYKRLLLNNKLYHSITFFVADFWIYYMCLRTFSSGFHHRIYWGYVARSHESRWRRCNFV